MRSNRWVAWVLVGLGLLVGPAPELRAQDPEALIDRLRAKLRETSSIYLEGTLRKLEGTPDTTQVVLAYQYPDRLLEIVRGSKGRRQILIFKGNRVAIRYPHLNLQKTRTLTPAERNELLLRTVPLAGVVAGLRRSEEMPTDRMTLRHEEGVVHVSITDPFGTESPYRSAHVVFERQSLRPRFLELEGPARYRLTITTYEEEKRFPLPIERAMMEMDPTILEERTS